LNGPKNREAYTMTQKKGLAYKLLTIN
jgi:hypothetical protein